jgi:hypothetical protein
VGGRARFPRLDLKGFEHGRAGERVRFNHLPIYIGIEDRRTVSD